MKIEQCIETLKELWRYKESDKYSEKKIREALDLAIKALEQQNKSEIPTGLDPCDGCQYELNSTNGNPCYSCGKYKLTEQQPCEDCVNREAVAEMLNEMPMKITETWMDFYRKALNSLNKLPSVTPTISKMEQVEDCISRQALIDELEEPMNWTDSEAELQEQRDYEGFIELLKSMPSVTPQRPKGKWKPLNYKDEMWGYVYECSNCGYIDYGNDYCPKCGADMREREVNADES